MMFANSRLRPWRVIAEELIAEQDCGRIVKLAVELKQALDDHQGKPALSHPPNPPLNDRAKAS